MVKLSASILGADLNNLESEVKTVEPYVNEFHIDIMDGTFVPSKSFGYEMVYRIRRLTELPLDVHLMVSHPCDLIDEYISAGANILTFHIESPYYFEYADYIKSQGIKLGVAYNPSTPIKINPIIDRILIMSVHPGSGGQEFIKKTLKKISKTKKKIKNKNLNIEIAVDGGITPINAFHIARRGADIFISGTSIFKGDKIKNCLEFRKNLSNYF